MPKPDLEIMTEYGGEHGIAESTLAVDRNTGELYHNGSKLITEKRFSSYERGLATIGLIIGGIGALAAVGLVIIEVGRSAGWWR